MPSSYQHRPPLHHRGACLTGAVPSLHTCYACCAVQRMTTYSRYTVAMTFRICFTFGILTVAYNW